MTRVGKGLVLAIIPLAITFTIITYNMYLPISSDDNAEFIEYIKHIGTDFYNHNQYVQQLIHKPITQPIQAAIEEDIAVHYTGPRPIDTGENRNVTLTFYLQYGNQKYLTPLLDLLDKYDIRKAVFFVEPRYQFDHPYAMKRIEHMGFDIKPWTDLKQYGQAPYYPSVYKDIPLKQDSILSSVYKLRIAANFLNSAVSNNAYGTEGVIIAFTPEIMEKNAMLLESLLKQEEVVYSNEPFERQSIIKTIPVDSITSVPIRIDRGFWTMEGLHANYPSIVKNGPEGSYVIMDPIVIRKYATLDINDETVYLNTASNSNYSQPVYIRVIGKANITDSNISSWDTTRNAINDDPYAPRGYILVTENGTLNVDNSTITHLGYSKGGLDDTKLAVAALNYFDTGNFTIADSTLAHNYYGFYSQYSKNFVIKDNEIFGQVGYGLDPHTGSGNFTIDGNYVHDNGNQGIICSLDCYNVTITDNTVDYNVEGIGLHWNTNGSRIEDNTVRYNEKYGIFIQRISNDNLITNNTLVGNGKGIGVLEGSNKNSVFDNIVAGTPKEPIFVSNTSYKNEIRGNTYSR